MKSQGKTVIVVALALSLILIGSCVEPTPPTAPLNAEFSASITKPNVGEEIKFIDATTGGTPPYSYEWDFDNDGKVDSTDANPTFVCSEPGTYTISLKASDAKGKTDAETKQAYITVATAVKDVESTAKHFVSLLSKGDFDEAYELLAEVMVEGLKEQNLTLEGIWSSLIAQVGRFKGIKETKVTEEMGYECVYVACDFENTSLNVKVVLDKEAKVAGLFFLPAQSPEAYRPPEYTAPGSFTERECVVGDEWQLPATLTIPKGEEPFPAVVLVHGSGPHDRDETIGPNKPFKDLALGLAARGTTVLRYEKRTRQYATEVLGMMEDFTVNEETIDDALAAVDLLRKTKEVDPGRIFILGHSLGAVLAPRIAAQGKGIAGLILLAGCPEGLYIEKALEQTEYLVSLDGKIDEAEVKQLEEVEKELEKVQTLNMSEDEIILGASKAYWADLMAYDPVKTARGLTTPMLILQGERDYQVTMEDFEEWREGLAGHSAVDFKVYPELNHLFISGTGKSVPAEYNKPGNIAQIVIEDIAEWIRKH